MPQKDEYSTDYDSYSVNCNCSRCTRTREKKREKECQCNTCRKPKVKSTKLCEHCSCHDCSKKREDHENEKCKRERHCCDSDKDECKSGKIIVITIN